MYGDLNPYQIIRHYRLTMSLNIDVRPRIQLFLNFIYRVPLNLLRLFTTEHDPLPLQQPFYREYYQTFRLSHGLLYHVNLRLRFTPYTRPKTTDTPYSMFSHYSSLFLTEPMFVLILLFISRIFKVLIFPTFCFEKEWFSFTLGILC